MGLSTLGRYTRLRIQMGFMGLALAASAFAAPGTFANYPDSDDMNEVETLVQNLQDSYQDALDMAHRHLGSSNAERRAMDALNGFSSQIDNFLRTVQVSKNQPQETERVFRRFNINLLVMTSIVEDMDPRQFEYIQQPMADLNDQLIKLREVYGGGFDGSDMLYYANEMDKAMDRALRYARQDVGYNAGYQEHQALNALEDTKGKTQEILRLLNMNSYNPEFSRKENGKLKKFFMTARTELKDVRFSNAFEWAWYRVGALRIQISTAYHQDNTGGFSDYNGLVANVRAMCDLTARLKDDVKNDIQHEDSGSEVYKKKKRLVRNMESLSDAVERLSQKLRDRPSRVCDTESSFTLVREQYAEVSSTYRGIDYGHRMDREFDDLRDVTNKLVAQYAEI